MANSLEITLAPQFEIEITHNMGGVAAGFTIVAGISRSTGGGAGNEYLNAEKVKLAGIETAATADQTGPEIKALYEQEASAFTDTQFTKLGTIEGSATADQSNAEIRTAVEAASDSNVFTDADHSKLNAIEANATADQTDAQIRTAVEAASDSNVFTDADHSKLGGIEAGADVSPTPLTNGQIKTQYEANSNTNVHTDAQVSKLAAIEASATADQSDSEIAAAYANEVAQVSAGEITAGSEPTIRTYAPDDIVAFIATHETDDMTDQEIEDAYNAQVAQIDAGEIADGTEGEVRRLAPDDLVAMITAHAPAAIASAHYQDPVADIAELTALPEAALVDAERRFVELQVADYFYDIDAVSGDEQPDDQTGGTGFWITVADTGGGSSPAQIKSKYEKNANTNAFEDAEKTKLGTIEDNATADQSDAEIRAAVAAASDSNVFQDADASKLDAIEDGATVDQTDSEIATAYGNQVGQVSGGEITAGSETALRTYSPADIVALIAAHETGPVATAVNLYDDDHTLALTDAEDIVEMDKATVNVLTIPLNATVAFPVGTVISVSMIDVGVTSITAVSGVTLNRVDGGSGEMNGQDSGVSLYQRAVDVWLAQGGIGTVA